MGNTLKKTEGLLSRPAVQPAHEAREIANAKATKRLAADRKWLTDNYRAHRKYVLRAIKDSTQQGYFSAHYWMQAYHTSNFYNADETLRKHLIRPLRTELKPLGYSVRLVQCKHGNLGVSVSWQKGKTK